MLPSFGGSIVEKSLDLITTQEFLSKDRSLSYLPRGSGTSHIPLIQLVPLLTQ